MQTLSRRTAALIALLVVTTSVAQAQRPRTEAEKAWDRGDPRSAAAAYLAELKAHQDDDTAWYNAGTAALAAGDPALALEPRAGGCLARSRAALPCALQSWLVGVAPDAIRQRQPGRTPRRCRAGISRGAAAPAASHPSEVESGAGESVARGRWTSEQTQSAAPPFAWQGRRRRSRTATAAGGREQQCVRRFERRSGRSGVAIDRARRAAHPSR